MTQEIPENTDDKPGLPIMQSLTGSEEPADNLNNLSYITEFLIDAVIAMGYAPDESFFSETAEGMACILKIIRHDLEVISKGLPAFMPPVQRKK